MRRKTWSFFLPLEHDGWYVGRMANALFPVFDVLGAIAVLTHAFVVVPSPPEAIYGGWVL